MNGRPLALGRVSKSAALVAWVGAALVLVFLERAVSIAHGVALAPMSGPGRAALFGLQLVLVGGALGLLGVIRAARRFGALLPVVVAVALGAGFGAAIGRSFAIAPSLVGRPGKVAVAWIGCTVFGASAAFLVARVGWRADGRIGLGLAVVAGLAVRLDATYAVGTLTWIHDAAWAVVVVACTLVGLRITARRPMPHRAMVATSILVAAVGLSAWLAKGPRLRAELFLKSSLAREALRAETPAPKPPAEAGGRGMPAQTNTAVVADACVLMVTIDALRADAIAPVRGAHGSHARPGDTPALDAFVAESVAFRYAYAPASYTSASLRALLSSRPPWPVADRSATLHHVLADSGRITIAAVDDLLVHLDGGVVRPGDFTALRSHGRRDMGRAVDDLLALVDFAEAGPWFAWMHVLGPHAPGFAGAALDPDLPRAERYRLSVRWLDGEMGRLLEGLRVRGLEGRTIVIFTADHGEALGEHGIVGHGATVFEAEVRVPLVMRIPGVAASEIAASVSLVDVMPTILELVGAAPHPSFAGHSLVPLVRDPGRAWPHDVVTMSRRDGYALVRGRDKLVLEAGADVSLVFDLAGDPGETTDLAAERPNLEAELTTALRARVWGDPR